MNFSGKPPKLTREQFENVQKLLGENIPRKTLAERFGVSLQTINNIATGHFPKRYGGLGAR